MAENCKPPEAVTVTVIEEKTKKIVEDAYPPSSTKIPQKSLTAENVSGLLSIFSFILSLPILGFSIWEFYMRSYTCESILRLPKVQIWFAVALLSMFLISNAAIFLRSRYPMLVLIFVLVPLIVMLTAGLSLVGAYSMESRTIPASPKWFKWKVHDDINWNNIKSCLYDNGACHELISRSVQLKSYDLSTKSMTAIESGCCKPPSICGMAYVNATYWMKPATTENSTYRYDKDCDVWRNNHTALCYDCQACRQGFVMTLEDKWWKLGVFLVIMALLLIVSHLFLFFSTTWEWYGG